MHISGYSNVQRRVPILISTYYLYCIAIHLLCLCCTYLLLLSVCCCSPSVMKGWIQRSRYMKELARRAEAASKIQTGVCTVTNGNYVGHPTFVNLICVITETLHC